MRGGLRGANILTRRRCLASLIFSEAGVCVRVCCVAGHSFSPGRHGGGRGVIGAESRAEEGEWTGASGRICRRPSISAHVQPYTIHVLSLGFMCHCLLESATCEEKDDSGRRPS
jgi:hypothetical protein